MEETKLTQSTPQKQIATFKLISGEELISEYNLDDQFYLLKQPRRVVLSRVGPEQYNISLAPWFASAPDGTFPVHAGHVISVAVDISEGLKAGYLKETSALDLSAVPPTTLVGV